MNILAITTALAFAALTSTPAGAQSLPNKYAEPEGTFSIIAHDPVTGELGMGVQSKTIAVGARTRWGQGGIAIIASQAASNPMYGDLGIVLMERGMTPQQALEFMLRADADKDRRQVGIIDIQGRTASWEGARIQDWSGHVCGVNYCAQGNTLTAAAVVTDMAKAFEAAAGALPERLLAGLDAAQAAGGDRRGRQSAALLILKPLTVQGYGDRALDLRVDEHKSPLPELRRVLNAVRANELLAQVSAKIRSNDLVGAMELARGALQKNPDNDGAYVAIADISLRVGKKQDALDAVRQAVALNVNQKGQLLRDADFKSLQDDPQFKALVE